MSVALLDSNILLYLFDNPSSPKRAKAESLLDEALATEKYVISWQVVQETLNGLTYRARKPALEVDPELILERILKPLWRVMPSAAVYERGLYLKRRYQYSFYDSLILAAALEADCDQVFSEDMQDGQQIERLTIVNPFKGLPDNG